MARLPRSPSHRGGRMPLIDAHQTLTDHSRSPTGAVRSCFVGARSTCLRQYAASRSYLERKRV